MGFAVEELWVMGCDRFYGFYLTNTCPPSRWMAGAMGYYRLWVITVMGYHSFYCIFFHTRWQLTNSSYRYQVHAACKLKLPFGKLCEVLSQR